MAGNGSACNGLIHVTELTAFVNGVLDQLYRILIHLGVGHEDLVFFQILRLRQTVPYIGFDTLIVATAVFLTDLHLVVYDFDSGLKAEEIGSQGLDHRAATTLDHVIQSIQKEAGIYPGGKIGELLAQLHRILLYPCQTASL